MQGEYLWVLIYGFMSALNGGIHVLLKKVLNTSKTAVLWTSMYVLNIKFYKIFVS